MLLVTNMAAVPLFELMYVQTYWSNETSETRHVSQT
jgi:hypothetical protein